MSTLKVNGHLKSPSIWGTGASSENNNGIDFKSGVLYLYGKTESDTRGIYDSLVGSVISVTNSGMYFYGNANSATNSDTLDGFHASSFLQLSGGTMSGALNFANGTWNLLGDDVYFGDNNIAGAFCIKGANGTTNLRMVQYGGTAAGTISFDGSNFTISNYINGTISNASKWATARTLSLTDTVTGSVSFDGSGNATMSTTIKFVGITPSTFASTFRTMIKGDSSSGQFFSTIRSESAQSGELSSYGSGIAWGTFDTHGYMYINYASPQIFVGGGNGVKLNWTKQLAFTDSTVAGANYATNADAVDGQHFHWQGQSGTPTLVWGANSSGNSYVYYPANFSVNYANSTGTANALSSFPVSSNGASLSSSGWYKVATVTKNSGSTGPVSVLLVLGKNYSYSTSDMFTILIQGGYCNTQFIPIGHCDNGADAYTQIRSTGEGTNSSFDVEVYLNTPSGGNYFMVKAVALIGSVTTHAFTSPSGSVMKTYTIQDCTHNGTFGSGDPSSSTPGYGEYGALYYKV